MGPLHTNVQKTEMVQRRAARYVCNNYNREASVSTMIKHLHWRSLQQRRTDIRLVMFYKILHGIVALDLFPQLIPLVRPSRHTHSEAFQLPLITKQFIQYILFIPYSSQLEQPASQCSYSTKFEDFQTQDLQLAPLIDVAVFTVSTFLLLKLQFYTHTIMFSLSSKYCITFSYSTGACAHVHTHRVYKP